MLDRHRGCFALSNEMPFLQVGLVLTAQRASSAHAETSRNFAVSACTCNVPCSAHVALRCRAA